jgi:hypothetical protein
MVLRIDDIELDGPLGAEEAAALAGRIDAAFAAGAHWVAVEAGAAGPVDAAALAGATRRPGVVVCGATDALRGALAEAGVVATRRRIDVEVAARAGRGDGLKRRLELLELPRPDPAP